MEIEIVDPALGFLNGDAAVVGNIPIKVIRAARLTLGLIKAVPKPEQMHNWKSLDYKSRTLGNNGKDYSIAIVDDWRMDLHNDPEQDQPGVTVIGIRRSSDGY